MCVMLFIAYKRTSLEIVEGSLFKRAAISLKEDWVFSMDSMVIRLSRVRCLLLGMLGTSYRIRIQVPGTTSKL